MQNAEIQVSNLSVGYTNQAGLKVPILRNVNLSLKRGETIGLVGESGSGKSTLALAMMGYLKIGLQVLEGSSLFGDIDIFEMDEKRLGSIRGGKLGLVPQNAGQSLTPTSKIGKQISESLRLHTTLPKTRWEERIIQLLTQVRLPNPEELLSRYPHELSGGQQQRVAVAMALAGEPDVLLLDEPTTGLDVTTQAHILQLLKDLAQETGTAMVYVSHDLGAVAQVCNRVAVMYAGEIVLEGQTRQVLQTPTHPYVRGLLMSIPRLKEAVVPVSMPGIPPMPGQVGQGCAFAERCSMAQDICRKERPILEKIANKEMVRCHLHKDIEKFTSHILAKQEVRPDLPDQAELLMLDDVAISYAKPSVVDQLLGRKSNSIPTVESIDLKLIPGETMGLVGESGSGKSTILSAIAGLMTPSEGHITYKNTSVLDGLVETRSKSLLKSIQLIFQNPDASLNPRQTVAEILAMPLKLYFDLNGEELHTRSVALLDQVRLGAHYLDRLPSQLSGGEKQRVAVARAFAAEPELILCDEVTSALDVSVQAALLRLLVDLQKEQNTTYIFVSHDLAVVRVLADRVAVLYLGRICELGPVATVYQPPFHPYTEMLLGAVVEPDPDTQPTLTSDDAVELSPPGKGCAFQRRCPRTLGIICKDETPPWQVIDKGHAIRCHIPFENL